MRSITFQDVLQTQTTPVCKLGERAITPDGREWVYVYASQALSLGHVVVPNAVVDVNNVSSSSNAAGERVYITKASAGWTVDAYANGWVLVDAGTGAGQVAKIKSNTSDTLELYPEYKLATALSAVDSEILIWTQYQVRKALVTSKIQNATGIVQVAFASGDYGWALTKGIGTVIAGEALTVGGSFVTGDDTAGEVVKGTTAKGAFDEEPLGKVLCANTAADKGALVLVNIAS